MKKKAITIMIVAVFADLFALELINANANTNRFENGSVVSVLSGNVEFLWNDTKIFSDQTVWRRSNGHLTMTGNIRVLRNRQYLSCDSAEFYSNGKTLRLKGRVFAIDTSYCTTMFSGSADYFVKNDSVFLSKNPKIHFWDSVSTDTITVIGKKMNYASQSGIARAIDSVKIIGTDFVSTADTGFYFSQTEKGMLVGSPRIEYENSSVKGDTVHILFKNSSLDEFFVVGNPVGETKEEENGDSVFTELTGDTLKFFVEDKKISQILSEKNASFKRFRQDKEITSDKMWGDRILTLLDYKECEDCKVLSTVSGNAKAVYFDNKTKNESSGDTLQLFFGGDGVNRVIISGKVKGRIQE